MTAALTGRPRVYVGAESPNESFREEGQKRESPFAVVILVTPENLQLNPNQCHRAVEYVKVYNRPVFTGATVVSPACSLHKMLLRTNNPRRMNEFADHDLEKQLPSRRERYWSDKFVIFCK